MNESTLRDYEIEWIQVNTRIKKKATPKERVIKHYSNGLMCCKYCECSNIKKLCVHHSNGDGEEFRKATGLIGTSFYLWLIRNNFPDNLGLEIACISCNGIFKKKK